ncbi:butyrophilin-like protein 2 [Centroberyx gerrardi]
MNVVLTSGTLPGHQLDVLPGHPSNVEIFRYAPTHVESVPRKTIGRQPQVIGSPQPIVAVVGDDVILPCHVEPRLDVEDLTVEWTRPDLQAEYVHLYRHGHEMLDMKNPSYSGRTVLFRDGLKHGDISLKLTSVTLADEGKYRCFIPKLKSRKKESVVQLVVGQPQVIGSLQPIVAVVGDDIILPCHVEPRLDVEDLTVEWTRPDLRAEYVHLYRHGHEMLDMKNPSYSGRTVLFRDGLKHGDISLKLTSVTLADKGKYRCFIPKLKSRKKESVVQLVVAQPDEEEDRRHADIVEK